jgi:hypothetical protein
MAVTLSVAKRLASGNTRRVIVDVTGPASYTTGGELLTAAQQNYLFPELGSGQSLAMSACVYFDSETEPANFRSLVLDKTNNKMLFTAAGAQVASTTNLSAVTIRCEMVYGGISGS